tara:strand:- start:103 stop:423 length:321 start_codon:yes stop_codon:yes gene_type:complete
LDTGASVNPRGIGVTHPRGSALHVVENKAIAELLIAEGADVDADNLDGETPLHRAAFRGHEEIAELLIAKGADVNAKDELGWTPLHNAAYKCQKEVAELLILKIVD